MESGRGSGAMERGASGRGRRGMSEGNPNTFLYTSSDILGRDGLFGLQDDLQLSEAGIIA